MIAKMDDWPEKLYAVLQQQEIQKLEAVLEQQQQKLSKHWRTGI
jgi:hypothetical protein